MYLIDQLVRLGLPRRRLPGGRVELVVEQGEGFFALNGISGEEITIPERELDLDVKPISVTPGDEGGPQPVVDVVVADVADNVRSPIDTFLKICK